MIFTTVTISVTRMTTPPTAHEQLGSESDFLGVYVVRCWLVVTRAEIRCLKFTVGRHQVSFLAA